jgi:heat shock protein HslJ
MSTDDMDARLQQAGERWREHNTDIAAIDLVAATAGDSDDASTMVPLVADHSHDPRRRRWIWLSSAAGIAAAVAAALIAIQLGGSNDPKPQPAGTSSTSLVGTQWQLAEARNANGTAIDVVRAAGLMAKGAGVAFDDGCTFTKGNAEVRGQTMTIDNLVGRASGCPPAIGDGGPESTLIAAMLTGTVEWSVVNDELTLSKPGVGSLTYRVQTPPVITEPKALMGKWSLVTITSPTGASASAARPAYLVFAPSTFSGTDACNNISGDVAIKAGRVDFGDVASTAMGCVGADVNAESSAIDAILGQNVSWSIQNDRLTLTKDGAGTLSYQRADIDPGFTGKTGGPSDRPSTTPTK